MKAFGDLDEDDRDTKISCTKIELIERIGFSNTFTTGSSVYGNTSGPPMVQPGL